MVADCHAPRAVVQPQSLQLWQLRQAGGQVGAAPQLQGRRAAQRGDSAEVGAGFPF